MEAWNERRERDVGDQERSKVPPAHFYPSSAPALPHTTLAPKALKYDIGTYITCVIHAKGAHINTTSSTTTQKAHKRYSMIMKWLCSFTAHAE
eukprot:4593652-Ditylum_brightwellii.AAC.1